MSVFSRHFKNARVNTGIKSVDKYSMFNNSSMEMNCKILAQFTCHKNNVNSRPYFISSNMAQQVICEQVFINASISFDRIIMCMCWLTFPNKIIQVTRTKLIYNLSYQKVMSCNIPCGLQYV